MLKGNHNSSWDSVCLCVFLMSVPDVGSHSVYVLILLVIE